MPEKECPILDYYRFLGKKWTYPIIFHMENTKEYSFEDFIHITNRRISRSILLLFINEAKSLSIIIKENNRYILSDLGRRLKKDLLVIKKNLQEFNPHICDKCTLFCRINKERLLKIR